MANTPIPCVLEGANLTLISVLSSAISKSCLVIFYLLKFFFRSIFFHCSVFEINYFANYFGKYQVQLQSALFYHTIQLPRYIPQGEYLDILLNCILPL